MENRGRKRAIQKVIGNLSHNLNKKCLMKKVIREGSNSSPSIKTFVTRDGLLIVLKRSIVIASLTNTKNHSQTSFIKLVRVIQSKR